MRFLIRACRDAEQLKACVTLQKEIWGYTESEAYPARLFVNMTRGGGHILGAYSPDGALLGFVASMSAWHGRQRYFHSLSLGVKSGFENQGLGRALKVAQRKRAIADGIDLIEWTFDPLRAKNAFFNLVRLGAIVRQYVSDYYGPVESRLQLGLPSDRLIAEWHLRSLRVQCALAGKPVRDRRKRPIATVEIPSSLEALVAQDPQGARTCQAAVRKELQRCFRRGLAIGGFERGEKTSHYLLEKL